MSRENYNHIYLAFYTYQYDTSTYCSIQNKLTDLWCGPFTHVQICYADKESNEKSVLCTLIHGRSKGVCHKRYSMERPGYVYIKIPLAPNQRKALEDSVERLTSHKTYFSFKLAYGFEEPPIVSTESDEGWYCSQLTGFLLKRCGVLSRNYDINVNPTEFFIIIRNAAESKSENCLLNPFTQKPLLKNADEIYTEFTGKTITDPKLVV